MLDLPAIRIRALQTLTTYSLPMAFAFIGTFLGIYQILFINSGWYEFLNVCVMAAGLSFLASIIVELLIRHDRLAARNKIFLNVSLFLIMLVMAAGINNQTDVSAYVRYFYIVAGLFLILLGLPYFIYPRKDRAFWFYNDALCTGLLYSILANLTVAAGWGAIVLSCNYLFDITISFQIYCAIMLFISGFGVPLLWLQAIPLGKADVLLPETTVGNKMKQNITVWFFTPLVLIYGLILHGYFLKIIVTQELPRGYLSLIILGFAGAAILSYLTSWIFRNDVAWLARFQRWLPYMLAAPLVFLCLAIGHRIHDYGFTANRILVCLFTLWLANAIVFIRQGRQLGGTLAKLPLTLGMIFLIAAVLPEIQRQDSVSAASEEHYSDTKTSNYRTVYMSRKTADSQATAMPSTGCILKDVQMGYEDHDFNCGGKHYTVTWIYNNKEILLLDDNGKPVAWAVVPNLVKSYAPVVKATLKDKLDLPTDATIPLQSSNNLNIKYVLENLNFSIENDIVTLLSAGGYLLFTPPK